MSGHDYTCLWANRVSREQGLHSEEPVELLPESYEDEYGDDCNTYMSKVGDGDFNFKRPGTFSWGVTVTFVSLSKEEVQTWTDGAKSVFSVLKGIM